MKRHWGILLIALLLGVVKASAVVAIPDDVRRTDSGRWAAMFVDRYVSVLQSPDSDLKTEKLQRAAACGLKFVNGNPSDILAMPGDADFSMSFTDGLYRLGWSAPSRQVEILVPARIDLLTLQSSRESESEMTAQLKNAPAVQPTLPSAHKSELRPISFSDYFVCDKGYYITPRLRHNVIYRQMESDSDKCELLIDTLRYQSESVANAMLTGYFPCPLPVSLTLRGYGYSKTNVDIPFSDLFSILLSESSTPYWGVEKYNGSTSTGVYLWVNQYAGFAHLLSVNIPTTALYEPSRASATFYPYIRLDNVKSLFEELD